jgi:hypothetical protein
MTSEERAKKLYQLNGKLFQLYRGLGVSYGVARSLGVKEIYLKQLSKLYSNLKETMDAIKQDS